MKCKSGHLLSLSDLDSGNYLCEECKSQAYYPRDKLNHYQGFDEIRYRSIIDNKKAHFVFKSDDKTQGVNRVYENDEALEQIAAKCVNRRVSNKKVMTPYGSFSGIQQLMMEEGNNCAPLSRNISNVVVRFDRDF